jgi:hypothetical protein
MSLIKKNEMTQKQLAANRRNQRLCHGPVTDGGRERIRAAHLRHGFYAQSEEVALRALGEDPAHFQELVEGLWGTYTPTDAMQEGLVIRMARAMWLMNRADRMQEGYAVRQAQEVSVGREDRMHVQMMRLKMTAESLRRLMQSVEREDYVTSHADLEKMKNLHQEGELKDMGEIALALFYQLEPPGTHEECLDKNEMARRALVRIKDIFGLNSDVPPKPKVAGDPSPPALPPVEQFPKISAAEWEARQRPRQLLENILRRQAEICEAQRKVILKESLAGPSPYERAAEIAPTHPNARLMRRMQDSNFREVRRLTNLLLKLKRHQRKMEALERENEQVGSSDV